MDKRVAVIGAGTAGITAAITLSDLGYKVYLICNTTHIGGTISQLDKQFPNDACGFCQVHSRLESSLSELCLKRDLSSPNIGILTNTRVKEVSPDNKRLKIERYPLYVNPDLCINCQKCEEVCPLETQSEFNLFSKRKAIYTPYPFAIPNTYVIDDKLCNKCGECVKVCPTDAINLDDASKEYELEVDGIIIATGFTPVEPKELTEYGYRFDNVITSLELERLLSKFGPTNGEVIRISDKKTPKRVALIHCAGSRDKERPYCSSACCMYAIKEARLLKEEYPDLNVSLFYMDLRDFGKGYYRYRKEIEDKIELIRSRPAKIEEIPETKNLLLTYETEDGKLNTREFELVVLVIGQDASQRKELAKLFGLEEEYGFIKTHPLYEFKGDGIFIAGSAANPKDLPDTVIETQAACGALAASIGLPEVKPTPPIKIEPSPKIGVMLCRCKGEIEIPEDELKKFFENRGIAFKTTDLLCTREGAKEIPRFIEEKELERLVVLACAPYGVERLLKEKVKELGWHPAQLELVPLREEVIWNTPDAEDITKRLAITAVEKLKRLEYKPGENLLPTQRALVIGGGVSGMEASLLFASSGIDVTLVERTNELGGYAPNLSVSLEGVDIKNYLEDLIKRVRENERIEILKNSEVVDFKGWIGNYTAKIKTEKEEIEREAGVVIIATGAKEYEPKEYGYGRDNKVITIKDLEKHLDTGIPEHLNTVLMIQCVGSRNEEHPYCSRVCCRRAIKNALRLREKGIEVTILIRDMMTYGLSELYYKKAREEGVVFIRFDEDRPPRVEKGKVIVYDKLLDTEIEFNPDWIVLSTGIVPSRNENLAKILGVELDEDGFFKEANPKFRPTELTREGIFAIGMCKGPKRLPESISEAYAAVAKALAFLVKKEIPPRFYVSQTNKRRCSFCGVCVDVCPNSARILDEEEKVAKVIEAVCQGCGLCASACPSDAAYLVTLRDKQVFSMIEKIVE